MSILSLLFFRVCLSVLIDHVPSFVFIKRDGYSFLAESSGYCSIVHSILFSLLFSLFSLVTLWIKILASIQFNSIQFVHIHFHSYIFHALHTHFDEFLCSEHIAAVSCVTSAMDNTIIISGSDDSSIILSSFSTGKLVWNGHMLFFSRSIRLSVF